MAEKSDNRRTYLLTKSKYIIGLQCPKYLWTVFHEPDKIPEPDEATQFRFDQGNIIGELAHKLFPGGINIPTSDFSANLELSKKLLAGRKPLFEAAFSEDDIYSRADILEPAGKDAWDIIEVKSSTEVKDVYLEDVAFQRYCYEKAGLKIRKSFVMVINNQYVKDGDIDPKRLFKREEVTEEIDKISDKIPERIEQMLQIIESKDYPIIKIGKICHDPYGCPLEEQCWKFLPKNNVFDLYRGGKLSEDLLEKEILAIKDIPEEIKLNDKQGIQRDCERTGKPHIHKENIKHFLKGLHYPLHYLDFETFNTVIPLYDGVRPYQQVPFQFSLHIVEKEGAKPKHVYFLASGKGDPRPAFLEELKQGIGEEGTIVVYNESFEKARLKELSEAFPKEKKWIADVLARFVDLLVPFRNFSYYHPNQRGSASIKEVMPALVGRSYSELDIANGGAASMAFLDITFEKTPEKERKKLRDNLEKYCGRDTEGMIWIVDKLNEIVK